MSVRNAQKIDFPTTGNFPYIIAVDPDVNWMKECVSVPRHWFKTEKILNEYDNWEGNKYEDIKDMTDAAIETLAGSYGIDATSYISNPSTNTYNTEHPTSINLGNLFRANNYRDGDITLTFVLPSNAPADAMVKGKFSSTETAIGTAEAAIEMKNFAVPTASDANKNAKIQQVTLTSDQYIELAQHRNLTLNIDYATYAFKIEDENSLTEETRSPRTRLFVNFNRSARNYGTMTSVTAATASYYGFGNEIQYNLSTNTYSDKPSNFKRLKLGDFFKDNQVFIDSYNNGNVYITFYAPVRVFGKFHINDELGWTASTDVDMAAGSYYTITLSDVFKQQTTKDANYLNNFVFEIYNGGDNFTSYDANNAIRAFVKWDLKGDVTTPFTYTAPSNLGSLVTVTDGEWVTSGDYPRLNLKSALTNYDGQSNIIVTVVTDEGYPLNAKVTGSSPYIQADAHYMTANGFKRAQDIVLSDANYKTNASNNTLTLEVYSGNGKNNIQSGNIKVYVKCNRELIKNGSYDSNTINYGLWGGRFAEISDNMLKIETAGNPDSNYDTQLHFDVNISSGSKIKVAFKHRSSIGDKKIYVNARKAFDNYDDINIGNFTTVRSLDFQSFESEIKTMADGVVTILMNLDVTKDNTQHNFDFDDVSIKIIEVE